MAITTGTVRCLSVSEGSAFTTIDESGGGSETLILWFLPTNINAFTRVLHSMWVSQLREAQAGNLTVQIIHPDDSANIQTVRLGVI